MVKKSVITIVVLIVLLAGALFFIGFNWYSQAKLQELQGAFQSGALAGYEQAVQTVFSQATTCNPVPVKFNNQTINLIAVECLNQQAGGTGQASG